MSELASRRQGKGQTFDLRRIAFSGQIFYPFAGHADPAESGGSFVDRTIEEAATRPLEILRSVASPQPYRSRQRSLYD